MSLKIAITALSSVSPLGNNSVAVWEAYLSDVTEIRMKKIGQRKVWAAALPEPVREEIEEIRRSDIKYKALDVTVLMAISCARKAVLQAGWPLGGLYGINIGSSRGATDLFEKHYHYFLSHKKAKTLASPTTTLGNISSWVCHDLQSKGPEFSHSITCSTGLHAVLNAVAWLQSGMSDAFLAGGSEAPLTPFTMAQMEALKIYATDELKEYPCQSLNLDKKHNTMVLGEGAAVVALERGPRQNALGYILGVGYATEKLEHNISITDEAVCFQRSMKMAMGEFLPNEIDAVVMHAPGTIKGDVSESKAIQAVFGEEMPLLTTNKWKIGHTFGASGILNMELALLMIQNQFWIPAPMASFEQIPEGRPLRKILVNAVGFGGNAVSILLGHPDDF